MKLTVIIVSALVLVCLLLAAEARGDGKSRGSENRSNGGRSQSRSGRGSRSKSRSTSTSEEDVCCGVPPCGDFTIRREEVNETSFMALDTITYTCATGHGIQESGASSGDITCQANCTWTDLPICDPLQCDAPEVGVNTEPFEAGPLTFSQTFNYQCLEGHSTTDNLFVICTSDGSLSSPAPSCTPVSCGIPPCGTNTELVSAIPLPFPSNFTYKCLEGFVFGESLDTICNANGTFSLIPPPQCTAPVAVVCGIPPEGGSTVTAVNSGPISFPDTFTYECNEGFGVDGSADGLTISCLASGNFSGPAPACSPVVCGIPPEGGSTVTAVNSGPISFQDTFNYECVEFFEFTGTSDGLTISCLASGMFSGPAPECTPIPCATCVGPDGDTIGIINGTNCEIGTLLGETFNLCGSSDRIDLNLCECTPTGSPCPSQC